MVGGDVLASVTMAAVMLMAGEYIGVVGVSGVGWTSIRHAAKAITIQLAPWLQACISSLARPISSRLGGAEWNLPLDDLQDPFHSFPGVLPFAE
jgi:hypothetical protein